MSQVRGNSSTWLCTYQDPGGQLFVREHTTPYMASASGERYSPVLVTLFYDGTHTSAPELSSLLSCGSSAQEMLHISPERIDLFGTPLQGQRSKPILFAVCKIPHDERHYPPQRILKIPKWDERGTSRIMRSSIDIAIPTYNHNQRQTEQAYRMLYRPFLRACSSTIVLITEAKTESYRSDIVSSDQRQVPPWMLNAFLKLLDIGQPGHCQKHEIPVHRPVAILAVKFQTYFNQDTAFLTKQFITCLQPIFNKIDLYPEISKIVSHHRSQGTYMHNVSHLIGQYFSGLRVVEVPRLNDHTIMLGSRIMYGLGSEVYSSLQGRVQHGIGLCRIADFFGVHSRENHGSLNSGLHRALRALNNFPLHTAHMTATVSRNIHPSKSNHFKLLEILARTMATSAAFSSLRYDCVRFQHCQNSKPLQTAEVIRNFRPWVYFALQHFCIATHSYQGISDTCYDCVSECHSAERTLCCMAKKQITPIIDSAWRRVLKDISLTSTTTDTRNGSGASYARQATVHAHLESLEVLGKVLGPVLSLASRSSCLFCFACSPARRYDEKFSVCMACNEYLKNYHTTNLMERGYVNGPPPDEFYYASRVRERDRRCVLILDGRQTSILAVCLLPIAMEHFTQISIDVLFPLVICMGSTRPIADFLAVRDGRRLEEFVRELLLNQAEATNDFDKSQSAVASRCEINTFSGAVSFVQVRDIAPKPECTSISPAASSARKSPFSIFSHISLRTAALRRPTRLKTYAVSKKNAACNEPHIPPSLGSQKTTIAMQKKVWYEVCGPDVETELRIGKENNSIIEFHRKRKGVKYTDAGSDLEYCARILQQRFLLQNRNLDWDKYRQSVDGLTRHVEFLSIVRHVLASCFYFDIQTPLLSKKGVHTCKGTIRCRLVEGSEELAILGKFLKERSTECPYFLGNSRAESSTMTVKDITVPIDDEVVSDMIFKRSFHLSPIEIPVEVDADGDEFEAFLGLHIRLSRTSEPQTCVAIMGFPRRLVPEMPPPPPDKDMAVGSAKQAVFELEAPSLRHCTHSQPQSTHASSIVNSPNKKVQELSGSGPMVIGSTTTEQLQNSSSAHFRPPESNQRYLNSSGSASVPLRVSRPKPPAPLCVRKHDVNQSSSILL